MSSSVIRADPLSESGDIIGVLQAGNDSFVMTFIDHSLLDAPIILKVDDLETLKKMVSFLNQSIATIEGLDPTIPKEFIQTGHGIEKKAVKVGISLNEIEQLYKEDL